MAKQLYLECNAGISGDMFVGAMLDLGADFEELKRILMGSGIPGFKVEMNRVKKSGLDCNSFDVILEPGYENHDHDMEYLHGDTYAEPEEEAHHDHDYHEDHDHEHGHHHRTLRDVMEIIDQMEMTEYAKALARRIFGVLADAESKAHGVPLTEVHFHEVGAIDSIVDIIAAAVCMDMLDVEEVYVAKLVDGNGTVRTQHGVLSVPVPAVLNTCEAYHIPLEISSAKGEFVTPTGAAIVAAITTKYERPKTFSIKKTGLGAGKREYEKPSILRAMLIEEQELEHADYVNAEHKTDVVYKLESNVDDCTGEALGFLMETLFKAGARDVSYIPCFMKKNRPGYQIEVVCLEADIDKMEELLFTHTTTIGVRRQRMERTILVRDVVSFESDYGAIKAKAVKIGNKTRYYPEYESIAAICRVSGASFQEIYNSVFRL
ncbi:MAG: nickel pincer cofactor biosynthesis protein LarC [Lachnospiraceae bacterium]|nr:nickel pincer cofactor biosynthesis protein LarC [Lachnospiraceae bacterium]